MKILDRYIAKHLIQSILITLFVLLVLFTFFAWAEQTSRIGKGNYTLYEAFIYVFLKTPLLAYELLPIASVIGSMAFLSRLAQNNELAVMRTSGISNKKLLLSLSKASGILLVFALIMGEIIAPFAQQTAEHRRSVALSKQITLKTQYGFWSRDGQNYINIRKILPGNELQEIYIYEFDSNHQLRSSTQAKKARYQKQQWILEDITQSLITQTGVESYSIKLARWDSLLKPALVNLVVIKPHDLSIWDLYTYIQYLNKNQQNSLVYQQALWFKIQTPLSILLMIFIAVPLVKVNARNTAIGGQIFMGSIVGIMFHIFTQVCGHLSVVYHFPPILSSLIPNIILALSLYYLLQRQVV